MEFDDFSAVPEETDAAPFLSTVTRKSLVSRSVIIPRERPGRPTVDDFGYSHKRCTACNAVKAIEGFSIDKWSSEGRSSRCKDCFNDPDSSLGQQVRKSHLKTHYGIDPQEYGRMFAECAGRCGICRRHQSVFKHKLCVDHCHATGRVRGLLCGTCNKAIGLLGDDVERIESAASWVRTK